jgi:DNA-binding NarL/FixJ family response regulator/class 3 adenylate cyclase
VSSSLPTGPVTFLCVDVEGSTRLAGELGEHWADVLGRVRTAVRDAIAAEGGVVVDARGDELFAAFEAAGAALQAAEDVHRRLADEEWPQDARVRVRAGLHTGLPMLADDGYVGIEVHRAHRIAASGHGGQIVLSEPTVNLLTHVAVRELGTFRLRDLPQPERIFQVGDFEHPPLRDAVAAEARMKIVIADDSVLLREGIVRLLEEAGFEVAAQSGTREDVLRHVAMHKPNVAIVDIRMPPTHTDEGLRAAKEIRERFPDTGVLVLSQYVEPAYAMELLSESAEGVGYLLKDRVSDVDEFAAAVRRVGEGGSALDPTVVSQLVGRRRREDPLEDLSPREREVLELMAEGRSNQAISERLFITPRAVEKHVTSIFQKLRLPASAEDHRRVLAVLTYLRG